MKKTLSFVLLLLAGFAQAQIPFVSPSFSSNTVKFEKAVDFCELPSGKFLFVGEKTHPDSTGFVFLTDSKGAVLRSKYLFQKRDTSDIVFSNCFFRPDGKISITGINYQWMKLKSQTDLYFSIIDSNLNLVHHKANKITNADTQLTGLGSFVYSKGNYFGQFTFSKSPDFFYPYTKLIRLNDTGAITASQVLDSDFYGGKYIERYGIAPISMSQDQKHLYFHSEIEGYLVKVDTSFRLIDSIAYNPSFFTRYTRDTGVYVIGKVISEIGENKLLVGSEFEFSFSADKVWGALKFDFSTRTIERFGVFPYFTDSYNAGSKQTSTPINAAKSGHKVYTMGYTSGTLFRNNIVVCAFDTNVHPQWIKRIGDSVHQFRPISIKACSDGSLMICAYSDSATSPFNYAARDESIYIIRLDAATGHPLSMANVSAQLRNGIALYPNPAKSSLQVAGAAEGDVLCLYTLDGQHLARHSLNQGAKSPISVAQLAPGSYLYRLYRKEQLLSAGLWIKE